MAASPTGAGNAPDLRRVGAVAVIASGLVFVATLAVLDWWTLPKVVSSRGALVLVTHGETLWNSPGHSAGVFTVLAAGTVAFAAASLLSDSVLAALPAACGAFYLLGHVFPLDNGFHYGIYRAGFWLATVAALAMAAGAVLAVAASARVRAA